MDDRECDIDGTPLDTNEDSGRNRRTASRSKLAQEKQASLPAGGTCIVVLRLESYVVLLCADSTRRYFVVILSIFVLFPFGWKYGLEYAPLRGYLV